MAKQTRQQRRARREQQKTSSVQRARQRQQQVRPAAQAPKSQTGARRAGGGSFIAESWAELKKVEWPGQPQLVQGTAVVLIACVIVGIFLWLADAAFKPFVQNILLGQ
jgi:preprotein translocase subunit SecE